jgi:hypothetical protein
MRSGWPTGEQFGKLVRSLHLKLATKSWIGHTNVTLKKCVLNVLVNATSTTTLLFKGISMYPIARRTSAHVLA